MLSAFFTALFLAAAVSARCPQTVWQEFNNHCYLTSTIAVPWLAMAGDCDYTHPNLAKPVSIHSQAESEFLGTQLSGQVAWIGLRRGAAGDFDWQDGSDVDFQHWADGEPSADGSCVQADFGNGGKWQMADCAQEKVYVCEMVSF